MRTESRESVATVVMGTRIRQARRGASLSQVQLGASLAAKLGRTEPFSQPTVSEMERDRFPVTGEMLRALADILNCSIDYLAGVDTTDGRQDEPSDTVFGQPPDLAKWLHTVSLPSDFPRLRELTAEQLHPKRRLVLNIHHELVIDEILDRAGRGSRRIAVLMSRGHGTTTLSRYLAKQTWERKPQRRLPVRLALSKLITSHFITNHATGDVAISIDLLRETLRRSILLSLIQGVLDASHESTRLERLIEDLISSSDLLARSGLGEVGEGLDDFDQIDWELLKEGSLLFRLSFDDLLERLVDSADVNVSLQVDLFPPYDGSKGQNYHQHAAAVLDAVERLRENPHSETSAVREHNWNEIYFLDYTAFHALTYATGRTLEDLEYPWYRPAEVFAILARHTLPEIDAPICGMLLASVLDPMVLDGVVAPTIPLAQSAALVRTRLQALTRAWDRVPFRVAARANIRSDSDERRESSW